MQYIRSILLNNRILSGIRVTGKTGCEHISHEHRMWIKTAANHIMIPNEFKKNKNKQQKAPKPVFIQLLAVDSGARRLFGRNCWSLFPSVFKH